MISFDMMQWVLTPSAQACVVFFAVTLVSLTFKRWLSPTWQAGLWTLVLARAALITSPGFSLALFRPRIEQYPPLLVDLFERWPGAAVAIGTSTVRIVAQAPEKAESKEWWSLIAIGWIVGVILYVAYLLFSALRLRRLKTQGRLSDDQRVVAILNYCRKSLGLRRQVVLVELDAIETPAVTGHLYPVILAPSRYWIELEDDEIRHVLMHELSHLKLWHTTLVFVLQFVRIVHWFNPLVHIAYRRLHEEVELACDARVLSTIETTDRLEYGRTLLKVQSLKPVPVGMLSLFGRRSAFHLLRRRIDMIRDYRRPSWLRMGASAVGLLSLSLVLLSQGEALSEDAPALDPKIQSQRSTVEIMRIVGAALQLWAADGGSGRAERFTTQTDGPDLFAWNGGQCAPITARSLGQHLVPKYLDKVPQDDGWGHSFDYCAAVQPNEGTARAVGVRSAGSDGRFEGSTYSTEGFLFTNYERDIVWADGYFVVWPTSPPPTKPREPVTAEGPGPWSLGFSDIGVEYELEILDEGKIRLREQVGSQPGSGSAFQTLDSSSLVGKTVIFTAQAKGKGLDGGYLLYVGGMGLGFKSDRTEPIQGEIGWTDLRAELLIAKEIEELTYGFVLEGPGQLEIRNISLRVKNPELRR